MAPQSDRRPSTNSTGSSSSLYQTASEVVLTGVAIIVPIVVTIYVLQVALSFLTSALQPLVEFLDVMGAFAFLERVGLVTALVEVGVYDSVVGFLSEVIAFVVLVGIVVVVGSVAYHPGGQRLVDYFDVLVASIPGIGTVYKSFRRMGDIMLDDEVENFQEVKLVELLGEGSYAIGFEVGHSPPVVQDATGEDVVTMFIPFAPNPVTGGFLTYVSEDRLTDVDMTVDEGIRNVITSGVAGHESDEATVNVDDVRELLDGTPYLPDATNECGTSPTSDGSDDHTSTREATTRAETETSNES